jgi:hypothetical protein
MASKWIVKGRLAPLMSQQKAGLNRWVAMEGGLSGLRRHPGSRISRKIGLFSLSNGHRQLSIP